MDKSRQYGSDAHIGKGLSRKSGSTFDIEELIKKAYESLKEKINVEEKRRKIVGRKEATKP